MKVSVPQGATVASRSGSRARSRALRAALLTMLGLGSTGAGARAGATPPGLRVLPTGGVGMEAAALLMSGQQGGTVPLAVLALPVGVAGDGVDVALAIDAGGEALLAEQAGSRLVVQVAAYALGNGATQVQASVLQTVEIDLEMHREALQRGGLRLACRLVLPPGDTSLRVLVRNVATDAVGLRVTSLAVPSLGPDRPVLFGPLFSVVPEGWLTVVVPGADAGAPWLAEMPGARPVIAAGAPVSFRMIASTALANAPLRVQARRGEELAADQAATVAAREPGPAPGLELLTLSFEPGAAAVGEVTLRVAAAAGEALSSTVPVVVADARQVAAAAQSQAPARSPLSSRARRAAERQHMASYREALRLLTGHEPQAAREAVVGLEARVLNEAEVADVNHLAEMELDVLRPLASAEAGSLVPVIGLYLDIFQTLEGNRLLSTHAREMVFRLAELQTENDGSPESRRLAASSLLALVGAAPPTASQAFVGRVLQRAVTYDPDHRTALLCAAITAERQGAYPAAIESLERLRRLEGENLEVRVRLAINRARAGDLRQARNMLAGVIASPAAAAEPAWWLSLAHQELARLHIDGDNRAAAETVLRAGLERFPGDEKLSLQLARLLAERGARDEAADVLALLVPSANDRGYDSARHRYALLPTEPLARAGVEVRQRAAITRGKLAAALDATAEAGAAR